MKPFYNFKERFLNAKKSIERFPISMISAVIAAIFFIFEIQNEQLKMSTNAKIGFFFLFETLLSLNLKLFQEGLIFSSKNSEDKKKNNLFVISSYLVSIPILISIYLLLFKSSYPLKFGSKYIYFGSILTLFVTMFYIAKISYHNDYIAYSLNVFYQGILSCVFSGVTAIGISIIFYSINILFELNISYKILLSGLLFILFPLNLGFFLSNFPLVQSPLNDYEVPKVIKKLIEIIIIPLISLYTIILYSYFFKVILTYKLPKGVVSNLVLWYSFITVFVIFVSGQLNSKISEKFKKFQPIFHLPLLVFMFYSLYLRISKYGFTINRYFVLYGGIFVSLSMLYYIFFKRSSNITVIILLSVIVLLSVVGPQSAYNISFVSQSERLKTILNKNEMLNDKKIVKNKEISDKDKREITNIVNYLTNNYPEEELKNIFLYDGNLKEAFGFPLTNTSKNEDTIIYSLPENEEIETSGYKSFIGVEFLKDGTIYDTKNLKIEGEPDKIKIYSKNKSGETLSKEVDIKDIAKKYVALGKDNSIISTDDLSVEGIVGNVKYKIIFKNLVFRMIEKDVSIIDCGFYFLFKRVY